MYLGCLKPGETCIVCVFTTDLTSYDERTEIAFVGVENGASDGYTWSMK